MTRRQFLRLLAPMAGAVVALVLVLLLTVRSLGRFSAVRGNGSDSGS
ncbi:MAG: hypothetical protein KF858_05755 [Candidatus Sumerlaeia bacterium]|nr:hypothetical protein [Candidatus Sumerlaeia bacterium]